MWGEMRILPKDVAACKHSKFAKHHYSLSEANPNYFNTTQWASGSKVPLWYMIYKVGLAYVFFVVLCVTIGHHLDTTNYFFPNYLVYVTHQGLLLLTLNYILDASLVFKRWYREHCRRGYQRIDQMNWLFKVHWVLYTWSVNCALVVSIIYWGTIFDPLEERTLTDWLILTLTHGFNSFSCVVDVMLNQKPWRVLHFFYSLPHLPGYAVFSAVYWKLGGLGICYEISPENPPGNGTSVEIIEIGDKDFTCDTFIYDVMDWDSNPTRCGLMILLVTMSVPVVHLIWMGVTKLRKGIFSCTLEKKQEQDSAFTLSEMNRLNEMSE